MAQLIIKEADKTSSPLKLSSEVLVFVPIVDEALTDDALTKLESVNDLLNHLPAKNNNVAYIIAHRCLAYGLHVLLGEASTDAKMGTLIEKLGDQDAYPTLRFVTDGGQTDLHEKIKATLEDRPDVLLLLDYNATKDSDPKTLSQGLATGKNYSYFAPHGTLTALNDFKDTPVPGYLAYLCAFGKSIVDSGNPNYIAPAGLTYGIALDGFKPTVAYSKAERLALECKDAEGVPTVGTPINPIVELGNYGVVIWGNATAEISQAGKERKSSSILSNRHISYDFLKYLNALGNDLMFRQNSSSLFTEFRTRVMQFASPYLESAIESCNIYKVPTSRTTFSAIVEIAEIGAVDVIKLNLNLVDSSVATNEE